MIFSQFELLIGWRYTRTKRKSHFISFISLISMLGIMLGVTALIVVLSVMNGFQKELRTRILGVAAHLQITGPNDRLNDWQHVQSFLVRQPILKKEMQGVAPYVLAQGMLSFGNTVRGTVVRGILPRAEKTVADVHQHMKAGTFDSLEAGLFHIVLGKELADSLGVFVGDKVVLIAPQGQVTPAGILPRLKQFTVTGIFQVGMYEYDASLALIHLQDAQKLYKMQDNISGLRFKLNDLFAAPLLSQKLMDQLPSWLYVSDWSRQHANFFRAVQIEKNVMFIILTLIVAVAAFNIVSTLVMVVTDKQADIAILRTLGASPRSILFIFLVQGVSIGVIGTLLGILGGVSLALNVDTVVPAIEHLFGIQFLAKDVYYITELPSDLQWQDVAIIGCVSFGLSLLATIYPSWRAAHLAPAEALRYE